LLPSNLKFSILIENENPEGGVLNFLATTVVKHIIPVTMFLKTYNNIFYTKENTVWINKNAEKPHDIYYLEV